MMNKKHDLAFVRVIDKIRVPEQYHRGKKLLEAYREEIRELYRTGQYTYKNLADLFDVSFGTIQVIINEKTRLNNLEIARKYRERNRDKINKRNKGKAMELRYYKKNLIIKGKIRRVEDD